MSNCSGDCNGCKPSSVACTPRKGRDISPDPDISTYLAPPPKEHSDDTPLDKSCLCQNYYDVPRYACLPCIRSWVFAVCKCKAMEAVEYYRGNIIAVDRIKMCIDEKKGKERIDANSMSDDGHRNCSCKSDR